MTRPKTPSGKPEPSPPGGRALDRARQFAVSRGLTPPQVPGATPPEDEDPPPQGPVAPEAPPAPASGTRAGKRPGKR